MNKHLSCIEIFRKLAKDSSGFRYPFEIYCTSGLANFHRIATASKLVVLTNCNQFKTDQKLMSRNIEIFICNSYNNHELYYGFAIFHKIYISIKTGQFSSTSIVILSVVMAEIENVVSGNYFCDVFTLYGSNIKFYFCRFCVATKCLIAGFEEHNT